MSISVYNPTAPQSLAYTAVGSSVVFEAGKFSAGGVQVVPNGLSGGATWTVTVKHSNLPSGASPQDFPTAVSITDASTTRHTGPLDLSGSGYVVVTLSATNSTSGQFDFYPCFKAED